MSAGYKAVDWNPNKKAYDLALGGMIVAGFGVFAAISFAVNPSTTFETLLIRGTSLTTILLLHVVLLIGPMARLDKRYLPLLYNRRHLGVTLFLFGFIHAVFSTMQFHALGDTNPLVSVFISYARDYNPLIPSSANIANFPFEPFGVLALVILFLMAATSHDFWLQNFGASFWKRLHQGVYVAYGAVLIHVAYGVLQSETASLYPMLLGLGFFAVVGVHVAAARKETSADAKKTALKDEGWAEVCEVDDVQADIGHVALLGDKRIALYRSGNKIFALANACRHQGGPIGEGRIIDGCITCPWHGWQYKPEDGASPPPFEEVIPTYEVRIEAGKVLVRDDEAALGTTREGAEING